MKTRNQNSLHADTGNSVTGKVSGNKHNQSKDINSLSHKKEGKTVYIKDMPPIDSDRPGIL